MASDWHPRTKIILTKYWYCQPAILPSIQEIKIYPVSVPCGCSLDKIWHFPNAIFLNPQKLFEGLITTELEDTSLNVWHSDTPMAPTWLYSRRMLFLRYLCCPHDSAAPARLLLWRLRPAVRSKKSRESSIIYTNCNAMSVYLLCSVILIFENLSCYLFYCQGVDFGIKEIT